MLVNCNSCLKKFEVPDSAITENGRLLQCGSCGNKWTQYPVKEKTVKNINKIVPPEIKKPSNINKKKNSNKRKKRTVNLYSEEYLKKKHGLEIKDPRDDKRIQKKKLRAGFGFYNYFILISIFVILLIGILNLTKALIIANYPFAESYISYLYEVLNIIKIFISNLIF
jgi:predicted Zn finger-like uncharacterized protein